MSVSIPLSLLSDCVKLTCMYLAQNALSLLFITVVIITFVITFICIDI